MLTPAKIRTILAKYRVEGLSASAIGRELGLSRQRIWQVLKQNGVDTTKSRAAVRHVFCQTCGDGFVIPRSRWRASKARHGRHFCSRICWNIHVEIEDSPTRQSFLRSWAKSDSGRSLPPNAVVHIEPGESPKAPSRYIVFPSSRDHVLHHRGQTSVQLWKGTVRAYEY